MKLTAILMIVGCLQVSANGFAQGKITMKKVNATLEEVLVEINKQTGVLYSANNETLKKAAPININVKGEDLQEVLRICFEGQPLVYSLKDNIIIVKEKSTPIKVTIVDERNPIDVRGKVTDEKGNPVQGVTVTIKGTNKQTLTDENGEFSLSSIDREAILVFTSVNMERFEVKVNGQAELAVRLKTKVREMSEVVVYSTGYQEIPKERATGSFAQPDKDMFGKRVSTDVLSKLAGITSGLVFSKDPNGNTFLRVRGQSTILAKADPLIIVDDFPYDGDISNINPNDIENVTILKDAAASSIWGVRAGNGVIVITTKRGKINQPLKVQLVTNLTVSEKPNLKYDRNFLNSEDFIDVEEILFSNGFYDGDLTDPTSPPISPVVGILSRHRAGAISASEATAQINDLRLKDVRSDLSKYFYQKAINQQYSVNLNAGGNKSRHFFSIGFDKNKLSQIGNLYSRFTLNSSNTFIPIKNLEISAGINYIQTTNTADAALSQIFTGGPYGRNIYPYATLAEDDGSPKTIVKDYSTSFIQTAKNNGLLDWSLSPIKEIGLNTNTIKNTDARIVLGIKYTFFQGFSGEVKYQFEKGSGTTKKYADQQSYFVRDFINQYSSVSSSGAFLKYNIPNGGIADLATASLLSQSGRGQINYTNKWNKSSIAAIIGIEIREITNEKNGYRLYGYNNDYNSYQIVRFDSTYSLYPSGSSKIPNGISLSSTLDRFRSYFSNVAYTYNNKYALSLSGRIDASNFFGVNINQKKVPLWSVGAKWDVDKEKFLNVKWLAQLKLRATYGFNGNLNKTVTGQTTARLISSSSLTGLPAEQILNPPNPNLKWEKSAMMNLGVDFSLQREIISGTIEYYRKTGSDLIGDEILAPTVGFISPGSSINKIRGNFATLKGSGLDVTLNFQAIRANDLRWTTTILGSYSTDKITHYSVKTTATQIVYNSGTSNSPLEGKSVYGIYSFRWAGLDPTTGDPRGILADTLSKNYSALTNLTADQISDIIYNGPALPVFFGGIRNTIEWRRLALSFNISFKMGHYFRRGSIGYFNLFYSYMGNKDFANRWQKPGDEATTNVPSMKYPADYDRDNFYAYSGSLVEKADHIRLQDLSLSYEINKKDFRKNLPFENIQLVLYANNLGIIWRANKYGIDPDFQFGYVTPKSISIGIKAAL